MLRTIDTALLDAPDRLPRWHELAGQFIAPLHIEVPDRDAFQARLHLASLRDIELVSPCSSPARIANGAGWDVGVLNLQLQLQGSCTNVHGGVTSRLDEGDFVLFDPAQPLELSFAEPTQSVVLRLPLAYVEARLPQMRNMVGVPVRGARGAGALFSSFMRTAWRQLEAGELDWGEELSDVLWPLLDFAYGPARGVLTGGGRRDAQLRGLFRLIDEHLCDPQLDTAFLAANLGVTARTVQLLFAECGTTPRAYIQRLRLERAAGALARADSGHSITEIAFEVGFNDLSAFCRAFQRRFGASPTGYRRQGKVN